MPSTDGTHMNSKSSTRRRQTGFSLVESLLGVAITCVALGSALPEFQAVKERRHLEGVSAQLETDIQLARSEAVTRNHTLRLAFASTAAGSCYVVHTGRSSECSCNPDGNSICTGSAKILRATGFKADGAVQLRSNVSSIVFDPIQGTLTPTGTFRFTGAKNSEVRLVVNIMGRVRACTPTRVAGYVTC